MSLIADLKVPCTNSLQAGTNSCQANVYKLEFKQMFQPEVYWNETAGRKLFWTDTSAKRLADPQQIE